MDRAAAHQHRHAWASSWCIPNVSSVFPSLPAVRRTLTDNSVGDNVTLKVYASSTGELGLSYTASNLPGGLSINSTTGLITGTPSLADQGNTYVPTVTVAAAGTTGSVYFSWSVGSANATSLVVGDTINTQNNVVGDSILLQVYSNDPDDLPLSYTASNLPGGLTINSSTGLISGTLPSGDGGNTYAVSVVISDSQSSGSLNFLWLVAANSSPGLQLEPIADQTNLNGDVAKLQVYAENASTSPTYSSSNLPSSASINSSTGLISGTLSTGVCTPTVTVTAGGSSFSETFDWTVNTRPTGTLVLEALPDQANVAGDAVLLQSYGSEPGGPALTYTASNLPTGLTINSSTGLITGTLAMVADGDTSYQASVTVSDGTTSVVQSFFWEVMAPPALVLEGVPNQENEAGFAAWLQVEAGSQDNLALSYVVSDLPVGLSLNGSTGLISGTLNPADCLVGSYGPTLTVSNGYTSAAVSFSWIVDPSVLSLAPITGQTTSEGQSVSLALSAWDSNSSAVLYFNASGLPAGLSINASTGLISGTVALGDGNNGGTYAPVVTVFDGISSVSASIGWTVPSAISITRPANQSSTEGATISLSIAASDATSGAILSYSVSGLPLGLTINPSTGVIGGTVALGAANGGPYSPVVSVSDGLSDQSIAFQWNVFSAISLGTVASQSDSEGSAVSVSVQATDSTPSMTLTYSLAGQPNGVQINPSTGLISGTISWGAANVQTSFTPEVTVTDGKSSAQESINWSVAGAITVGSLADQVNTAGDTVSLSVSASDGHSGQTLTYSSSALPPGLSVNASTGLISGTIGSTISYGTSYQPTIAVTDGTSTSEVSLTWTIGALVPAGTFYTQEGTALTVAASVGILDGAVAPDSLSLTVSQVSGTSDGSITVNSNGSFTYTPNSGWFGTDTFVVTVSDGSVTSAPITETIEVEQTLLPGDSDFNAVATGDFNGDGNADFVAAEDVQNKVYVFLGNGDGTFQEPTTYSVGTDPKALAVGDFGNGADDIAVANSGSNTVTILMNDGTGNFTTSQTLTVGTDPVALALGDFEGNSSLDLAVANKGSNTVSIFLNNGSGTFTLDTTITVGTSPDGVAAGDLNNDGFDDLVVANSSSNNVSVLLSNGDGTFASAVNYSVGTTPTAVVLADFNGDGNLDVAVTNGGSNNVSVLMGNGGGTLQTATNYAVGSDPVTIAASDDGSSLVVGNHGSNSLTVLANNGSGAFSVSQTTSLGESPDSVAVTSFANNNGVLYSIVDATIEEEEEAQPAQAAVGAYYKDGDTDKRMDAAFIKDLKLANYDMPTDAHLKNDLNLKITANDFQQQVRDTLLALANQKAAKLDFASVKQFVNYAKLLVFTVQFAQHLQGIKPRFPGQQNPGTFAEFPGSTCWKSAMLKFQIPGDPEKMITGLALKDGVTPANGIEEFFGKNGAKAALDCSTFVSVVTRRALLEIIGKEAYNKAYAGVGVGSLNLVGDPFPMNALLLVSYPKLEPTGIVIPGMGVRFAYPKGTAGVGVYENENTILVGKDQFIGQPFQKPLTAAKIIENIEGDTKVLGTKPDFVSTIDFTKLPK